MILNWVGYTFDRYDGYGRYGVRMVQALRRAGVEVRVYAAGQVNAPAWLQQEWGCDSSHLTISCLPPYYAQAVNGPHWILTMTEGSKWPAGWDERLYACKAQRVLTPSQYNAEAIRAACPDLPVHVVHGGTCPEEFHLRNGASASRPYTFLCLADRGARKGWGETYEAFWRAFGRHKDTPDVKLVIKARPVKNPTLSLIADAEGNYDASDPARVRVYEHIEIWREDVADMRTVYDACDVFVAPSYSEGWGMPHREAAMMGLPVITQRYSGLDDGHIGEWSLPIADGQLEDIPWAAPHIEGQWMRPNVESLAETMRWCYDNRKQAQEHGYRGAQWLRENQTWDHAAVGLLQLVEEYA